MKNDTAKTNTTASPNPFASFSTICPKCKTDGKLHVVSCVLSASGTKIKRMNAELSADGFEVPTTGDDASTEDEIVQCGHCKRRFPLSEVTL
jgi:hypothetical protein